MSRLTEALKAAGAVLKREKKHRVYELPNGRTFVAASTPSDYRAEENALSDLRAVTGAAKPGQNKASSAVRAERRRRPGRDEPVKWPEPSASPLASALRDTGIVEQRLRTEITVLTDMIAARDAQIAALNATWPMRVRRWIYRS